MRILEQRTLGFRTIDVILFVFLLVLILGVYLAKTMAGGERGQIAAAERRIAQERESIGLLSAEVAHLERPERLAALARAYGALGPVSSSREISVQGLADALQAPAPPTPQLLVVAAPALPEATGETAFINEDAPPKPAAREPKP